MRIFSLPSFRSFRLLSTTVVAPPPAIRGFATKSKMAERNNNELDGQNPKGIAQLNPKVVQLQKHVRTDSSGGWDKTWEQGVTPWDLGQPTPILLHLHQIGALPGGRALVPGCGTGYDVVTLGCPYRYVVGLDISENAIKKAKEMSLSLSNADSFIFLKEDFFKWHPDELFDLIFDYTFFCAIEPYKRSEWAQRIHELLKPDGELITLMFPIDDHKGGPPYKVSAADYEEVLLPLGFRAVSIADNELAVGPRKGREKLGRWKRFVGESSL